MLPAVLRVNVIEANRRRCNEPHWAAFQEIGTASRPGSCDQSISIPDIRLTNLASGQVADLGKRLQDTLQVRDLVVCDDLHENFQSGNSIPMTYCEAGLEPRRRAPRCDSWCILSDTGRRSGDASHIRTATNARCQSCE